MHSVDILYTKYRSTKTPERFGQWFINRYVVDEGNDPDLQNLFYCHLHTAYQKIRSWLDRNGYSYTLPNIVREVST
jgi:hypothetical protein